MTAYATNGAGTDWSTVTNWTPEAEAGGPANEDTISLGHNMTVDVDVIIGDSPAAGNDAITFTAAVTLTVDTDKTLVVRGDVSMVQLSYLTLSAGATLRFDSSQAAAPSTTEYTVLLGNQNYATTALICNGLTGNHCTVDSDNNGANGNFSHYGSLASGQVRATYTDFTRIGTATTRAFSGLDTKSSVLSKIFFDYCHLTECGEVRIGASISMATDEFFRCQNTTFSGGIGTYDLTCPAANAVGTGERLIDGCVFGGVLNSSSVQFTITDCVFYGNPVLTGTWTEFSGNFVYQTTDDYVDMRGDATDCFLLRKRPTDSNFHCWRIVGERDGVFEGIVIECDTSSENGDMLSSAASTGAYKATYINCILLPNNAGVNPGTFVNTTTTGANRTVTVEHCTFVSADTGEAETGIAAGEGPAQVGMFDSIQSNIAWSPNVNEGYLFHRRSGETTQDIVPAASCDYNCSYQLLESYYAATDPPTMWSSGTGGANDVNVNPGFVDATRNLRTWDASLGGDGTNDHAIAELMKLNDADWNSDYNVADLLTFVCDGFKVTNSNLEDAGHDSVTIGACAYQAASTPPNILPTGPSALIS